MNYEQFVVTGEKNIWFSHLVVASAIINAFKGLNLQYPVMSQGEHKKNLAVLKEILEKEAS